MGSQSGEQKTNSSAAGGSAESTDGKHLNFGCYVYSTSYDPAEYQNAAWDGIRHGITEGLFKFKDDLTVDYNLCDQYEVSDDHKTWTFHIRDGVQFSNGNACDAQAVADSLNRLYTVCATEKKSSTPETYLQADSITADTSANAVTIVTAEPYADITSILC